MFIKKCSKISECLTTSIFGVGRSIFISVGHTLKNTLLHPLRFLGLSRREVSDLVTVYYPDERRAYPTRYRSRHRLLLNENGEVRCTACGLCATACPAKCIHIEAMEGQGSEKCPSRYEIDTLRCAYCGLCVEACPVDALRMDCGLHPEVYPSDVRLFVEDKDVLMQRSREFEKLGESELYLEHMQKMQEVEAKPHLDPYRKRGVK